MSLAASDLAAWLSISDPTVDQTTELTRLLGVATNHVGSRVVDTTRPEVDQAVLMFAARLYKRRNSPEGALNLGDYSVNIPTWDADIEALIAPFRAWRFGS